MGGNLAPRADHQSDAGASATLMMSGSSIREPYGCSISTHVGG
jgi:hypothetical protein